MLTSIILALFAAGTAVVATGFLWVPAIKRKLRSGRKLPPYGMRVIGELPITDREISDVAWEVEKVFSQRYPDKAARIRSWFDAVTITAKTGPFKDVTGSVMANGEVRNQTEIWINTKQGPLTVRGAVGHELIHLAAWASTGDPHPHANPDGSLLRWPVWMNELDGDILRGRK